MKPLIPFIFLILLLPFYVRAQTSLVIESEEHTKTDLSKTEFQPANIVPSNLFFISEQDYHSFSWMDPVRQKPGLAFIGSAILPGFSQAVNKNWIRAGLFMAVEITSIYLITDYNNRARKGERNYENWADQNWSVVGYANWLVDYHDVNGIPNPYLDDLRNDVSGLDPAYQTSTDWSSVDIQLLRNVERNTPFLTSDDIEARNFSHTLPQYGSQQYYELISKYYQYQAGWRDYHDFHDSIGHTGENYNMRYLFDRNGAFASPLFFEGASKAEQFNNYYRNAGNLTSLLIVNHVISAFDAFFTVKLKQNQIKVTPGTMPNRQLNLTFRF
ncbi:MAG: hypothetical protein WD735_07225 [Balneolaceae bacterium]